MTPKNNSFSSFFSSVRLTIILFVLIACIAIAGTLIPQQENARELIDWLKPEAAHFLLQLQIFDLFHSYIFRILTALLVLNVTVCSLNRLSIAWKNLKASGLPVPVDFFAKMNPEQVIATALPRDAVYLKVHTFLKRKFRHVRTEEKNGSIYFFCERHRFAHLGTYVVHLSVLVIILGVLTGFFLGFEGYLDLDEGQSAQTIILKDGQAEAPLGFHVRCDRFLADFYENGAPKTYRSDLSFIKAGRIVKQGAVLVNHPLNYDSIHFYQAGYGISPDGKYRTGLLVVRDPGLPIVAVGGILLISGLLIVFGAVRSRIWICLGGTGAKTDVRFIADTGTRHWRSERERHTLFSKLSKEIESA